MAIAAGDFRTGLTLIVDGDPWVVLDFQHVKPGKGAAILKTKMKNLKTGSTQDRNFNASTKFEAANIEKKTAQYSYEADSTYYFMDMETFEQPAIPKDLVEDYAGFLKENMEVKLTFFGDEPLDIELPTSVDLKVISADASARGNTATGVTKQVITDTGLKVQTPAFVNEGDTIRVDTRTGEYLTRV